jgi:hypothetical protein
MRLEDDRLAAMLSESDRASRLCFKHQSVGCASEVSFFIAGFDSPHDGVPGCTARMGDKAKPSRIPRRRLCCLIAVPAVAPVDGKSDTLSFMASAAYCVPSGYSVER